MRDHITWVQHGPYEWSGEVGGIPMFGLHASRPGGLWLLATSLPGMQQRAKVDREPGAVDTCKRVAEAWLRDFVAGLGAIFKDEPSASGAGDCQVALCPKR